MELDAELTPEEIMMMQQMGIPFVSVAWAVDCNVAWRGVA